MINITNILPESNHKVNRLHLTATLLFLFLFAFPLFPLKFTNLILMLVSAFTMLAYFIKPFPIGKIILRNLVFVLPFVPYLIEFFATGFNSIAHFEFEKKLFFFTAPLVFPVLIKLTGFRNYKLALLVFALTMCLLTLYTLVTLMIKGIPFVAVTYQNGAFILRDNFERISGQHPTYYSLFAISSACFLAYAPVSGKMCLRVCFIILAAILLITVFFLAVRIAFVSAAIMLLIIILKYKTTGFKKFILMFYAILILIIISFTLPSLKNRMAELISLKATYSGIANTVSQRVTILNCSLQVFSENIWFGTGSRNFQHELNKCYVSEGMAISNKQSFNPHNQYLSIGINYGIIILLIFIASLVVIYRKIFLKPEGIYFGVATLIFFISESMLERQMGVYMFGMIALLLYNVKNVYDPIPKTG